MTKQWPARPEHTNRWPYRSVWKLPPPPRPHASLKGGGQSHADTCPHPTNKFRNHIMFLASPVGETHHHHPAAPLKLHTGQVLWLPKVRWRVLLGYETLGPSYQGHVTHETESPWPLHFKHSRWWRTRSRSKFAASHYAQGTNGAYICECKMDIQWRVLLGYKTLGPSYQGHVTHETESPWPLHFKHSRWWRTRSRSKFAASHYAQGTNGAYICECKMDIQWRVLLGYKTLGPSYQGHVTHETESPWPLHFKHSRRWRTRSRSKFASSHHAWGTNGVCECKMDEKSTWKPPGDHGTPNAHNRWFFLFYHVWGSTWIE